MWRRAGRVEGSGSAASPLRLTPPPARPPTLPDAAAASVWNPRSSTGAGRAAGGVSRPRRRAAARRRPQVQGLGRDPASSPTADNTSSSVRRGRTPHHDHERAEPRRPEQLEPRWRRAASARHAQAFGERRSGSRQPSRNGAAGATTASQAWSATVGLPAGAPAHAEVVLPLCESNRPAKSSARRPSRGRGDRPRRPNIACRASAYVVDSLSSKWSGTQACICVLRLYGLIIRIIKSRVSASARTPSPDSRPSSHSTAPTGSRWSGCGTDRPSAPTRLEDGASWRQARSSRADGCRPAGTVRERTLASPRWQPGSASRSVLRGPEGAEGRSERDGGDVARTARDLYELRSAATSRWRPGGCGSP